MDDGSRDKKAKLVKRRKEEIVAAAKSVFATNGYQRTKIDDIADQLGVGKGTLYRYFYDKKTLFLAVYEQGTTRLMRTMQAKIEPIADPQEKIATAVRTYFEFFDKDRELIEILMQVRSEFKDEYRRIYLATYNDYIVWVQKNLRKGIELGIFRQMDVEKTANAMSSMLQGLLQSFYMRRLKENLTTMAEAVTALLLEGLLRRDKQ